jgi:hypothetical protein
VASSRRAARSRSWRWYSLGASPQLARNAGDNRAAVRAVQAGDLPLAGIAVYGPRNAVDKVMKGMTLHP